MTMNWKITPADRKVIREYAAKAARSRKIIIEVGERLGLGDHLSHSEHTDRTNVNIKLVDPTEHWEESDLYQTVPFDNVKVVELTADGEATLDFYIYIPDEEFNELETNVQAHIKLIDGKPRLWKMTDTDYRDLILI